MTTLADDNLEALIEENALGPHAGWQRRKSWLVGLFQADAEKLSLGLVTDDRERERAIGRCQILKQILGRDDEVATAYREYLQEQEADKDGENLEGGNFGVHYEGAQ